MTNEEIKKKRDEIYKILLSKCACITLNDEVNTKNFTSMEATKIVNFLESSKREEIIIFYVGLNLNETSYHLPFSGKVPTICLYRSRQPSRYFCIPAGEANAF